VLAPMGLRLPARRARGWRGATPVVKTRLKRMRYRPGHCPPGVAVCQCWRGWLW
jgi:hypothetical protein